MREVKVQDNSKYKDIAVLSIVPVVIVVLIIASWALAHWKVVPYFVSAAIAIFATLFGGFQRFIAGFKDIYRNLPLKNVLKSGDEPLKSAE